MGQKRFLDFTELFSRLGQLIELEIPDHQNTVPFPPHFQCWIIQNYFLWDQQNPGNPRDADFYKDDFDVDLAKRPNETEGSFDEKCENDAEHLSHGYPSDYEEFISGFMDEEDESWEVKSWGGWRLLKTPWLNFFNRI